MSDPTLDLVLSTLKELNEATRQAIASVASLQHATSITKVEQTKDIEAIRKDCLHIQSSLSKLEAAIRILETSQVNQTQNHTFNSLETRVRSLENAQAGISAISPSEIGKSVQELSKKYESLYAKHTTIAAVIAAAASIIITILAKLLIPGRV